MNQPTDNNPESFSGKLGESVLACEHKWMPYCQKCNAHKCTLGEDLKGSSTAWVDNTKNGEYEVHIKSNQRIYTETECQAREKKAVEEFAEKLRQEYDCQEALEKTTIVEWRAWKGIRNAITDLLATLNQDKESNV